MSDLNFLNKYYGLVVDFYDFSRKYFLFGRDKMLEKIKETNNKNINILEIGAGTGRNLFLLNKFGFNNLFAVEPCSPMINKIKEKDKKNIIKIIEKMGDQWSVQDTGTEIDVIYFSYALSMFDDPKAAIINAYDKLKVGGKIYIVDFGIYDGSNLFVKFLSDKFLKWLKTYHVNPLFLNQSINQLPFKYKKTNGLFNYFSVIEIDK